MEADHKMFCPKWKQIINCFAPSFSQVPIFMMIAYLKRGGRVLSSLIVIIVYVI